MTAKSLKSSLIKASIKVGIANHSTAENFIDDINSVERKYWLSYKSVANFT